MLTEEELNQLTGGHPYRLEKIGGGFQGRHWKLRSQESTFFVKAQLEGGYDSGAFTKEPEVYRRLLPALSRFTGGVQLWPRIYIARKGLMVLEDMAAEGWLQEVAGGFRADHVKAALSAMAGFHASSLMLGNGASIQEHFREELVETYFTPPALHTWEAFKETARKIFTKYFPSRKWETAVRMMDVTPELARPSTKFRNCVCHGDPWPNNIFFKYANGVAEKACLVDFAQVRYCPPASDILLFLRLLQIDDIDSYLIFYHSSLVKKVPSFSLEEFLDSCSEMDHFAFCVAPLYVYLTELPPAVIHQISRTPEDFMEFAMGKDEPALKAMDQDQIYRESVLRSFKELLDFADSQELKRGKLARH